MPKSSHGGTKNSESLSEKLNGFLVIPMLSESLLSLVSLNSCPIKNLKIIGQAPPLCNFRSPFWDIIRTSEKQDMNRLLGVFSALVAMALFTSCASGKLIEAVPSDQTVATDVGEHRLFLVGDAGEDNGIFASNADLLRKRIKASSIPATVVYLGDNIYPNGIPNPEDSSEYRNAVSILNAQMKAVEGLTEQTIFIPGNHDWNKWKPGGLKSIRRQEKLIRNSGIKKTELLPHKGCPGPEVVELTKDVALIIIDSQWWLQDWSTEPDINDDCNVRTRADFLTAFTETLKDYQEQQVIVALHHPLVSAGSHGGHFTFKDHLFPLTNIHGLRNFYLPLPILGSIYPVFRSNFGNIQDIVHYKYQELKNGLLFAARLHDNVIFVSGHEHSLEYHRVNNHHFVVSGAGSRHSDVGKPKSLHFGHGVPGFVQLNLKSGGAVDLLVWESEKENTSEPVYRSVVSPGAKRSMRAMPYPDISTLPDSVRLAISDRYAKGGLYRFFFGERYRDLYEIPVMMRTLKLDEKYGGLTPIQKGGGMQTNSLRLETADGKEYAARSMNKDASKLLPENLKNTFASDILQDQFTASHPYAAFVIPKMAARAGIYHTNPELMYMPKQDALGAYAEEFGDQSFLFEERPSGDWSDYDNFGRSEELISYSDVVEETMEDYRNRVDQEFVVRSRLFDLFIGDWDRHDDQWRWASFENPDGKGKYYRPVPRDRDQAFSDYDGLVVSMARWFTPTIRKLSKFNGDIGNVKWFNDNGKYFDRDFLNALPEETWMRVAQEVQASLPDALIEESIRSWPPEIFAQGGEHIISVLKQRRDNLQGFAKRYYAELAKTVHIRATNQADYIEISREQDHTTVQLFDSNKEGEKNDRYYSRTFTNGVTEEIQIYGLYGQDHINITGPSSGGIRMFVVGGEDKDAIVNSGDKHYSNIRVQDTQAPENIAKDNPVKYRRVGDDYNVYERKRFLYDYGVPKFIIAGNPDDGFLIGGGGQWTRHGFQKSPFASMHTLTGFYALATQAFGIDYSGIWTDVVGKLDFGLNASYKAPTFVQNFFGYGNESVELEGEEDKDFYRVRKRNYAIVPYLKAGKEQGASLMLKAGYESHEVENSAGRFVSTPQSGLTPEVFDDKPFAVVGAAFQYRIVDNPILIRRGVDIDISSGLDIPVDGDDEAHQYLKTSLASYFQFKHLGKPVLATRIGAEWHGGDYQFYQGAILGAQENFRGVPKERFVGNKMFYHNTDLRIRLSQWRSYYLPASFGIQLNFDHGRVWLDGEDSDTWHYAYGGGFWLSPFQTLLVSINYHKSDVDQRFSLAMGFLF